MTKDNWQKMGDVMKYRRLEKSRCPWCGEILDFLAIKDEKTEIMKLSVKGMCANCKKKVKIPFLIVEELLPALIGIPILYFELSSGGIYSKGRGILGLIPLIVFTMLHEEQMPAFRCEGIKSKECSLGRVSVQWYSTKRGGLGFASMRVINNTIFSIKMLDNNGNPIDKRIYVRLRRDFFRFWRFTRASLIKGDLRSSNVTDKSPGDMSEKFLIYQDEVAIGEGYIKKRGKKYDS